MRAALTVTAMLMAACSGCLDDDQRPQVSSIYIDVAAFKRMPPFSERQVALLPFITEAIHVSAELKCTSAKPAEICVSNRDKWCRTVDCATGLTVEAVIALSNDRITHGQTEIEITGSVGIVGVWVTGVMDDHK